MPEVVVESASGGWRVAVGTSVVHRSRAAAEAQQVAAWVRFQLEAGRSVDEVQALLRGESAGEEADLSILDGSIGDLKKALATGDHDDHLDALLAAEHEGQGRKGAISAIEGRRQA